MRGLILFSAFAGASLGFAADVFTTEEGLKVTLEHRAPSRSGTANALAIVERDADTVEIPCATNGAFLKKAEESYSGNYRAYCELVKFSKKKTEYDVIRFAVNAKFESEKLGSGAKRTYEITAEREDEDGLDLLKKEWKALGSGEFTADATAVLGRTAADSPFKLLMLIESALAPHVGKIAYAAEVERNVKTWGFNYFVGANYNVDLDGRWGKSGAKYTIQDSFSALKEDGNLKQFIFADRATLTERSAKILPSLDD